MKSKLKFREDGTFKIVQFTDLHWTRGDERDNNTNKLMAMIIKEEIPDLVVYTGDTINPDKDISVFERSLEPVVEAQVPFAMVFGNHDSEGTSPSKVAMMEAQQKHSICFTSAGEKELSGLGNYCIELLDSSGKKVPWILYFIDSGMYNTNEKVNGFYDYIKEDQIAWYENQTINKRKEIGDFSSLCFFHIPLPEFDVVWNTQTCYGEKNEPVCCPGINTGMFSSMVKMGDVKGVFVGHDHTNDYWGELDGIKLCYGRATGFHYTTEGFLHGARIIQLKEKENNFNTWIRLCDGTLIKNQQKHEPD